MDTSHQKDCGQDTKVNWNALWQFYQWSDPEVLTKILIRPHLEYAAPMWSPELIKDINKFKLFKLLLLFKFLTGTYMVLVYHTIFMYPLHYNA